MLRIGCVFDGNPSANHRFPWGPQTPPKIAAPRNLRKQPTHFRHFGGLPRSGAPLSATLGNRQNAQEIRGTGAPLRSIPGASSPAARVQVDHADAGGWVETKQLRRRVEVRPDLGK